MKKFLIEISIFLCFVVLIGLLLDYIISNGLRKSERADRFSINKIMNSTINSDVLIIGNSRASGGYNPYIIDSVLSVNSFNLGISGQPFGVSLLRYNLYKERNKKPKAILVNIDYQELRLLFKGFELSQYYPYIHNTSIKEYLIANDLNKFDLYCPLFRYKGDYKLVGLGIAEFLHLFHDTKGKCYKGYIPKDYANFERKAFDEIKAEKNEILCSCEPAAVQLLDNFCQEAFIDSIKVIFVYAPIFHELKNILNEKDAMQAYQNISQKYSIPILDYSSSKICKDSSLFYDTNHLNKQGANEFSVMLSNDIKNKKYIK